MHIIDRPVSLITPQQFTCYFTDSILYAQSWVGRGGGRSNVKKFSGVGWWCLIFVTWSVLWNERLSHIIHLSSSYPSGTGWFSILFNIESINSPKVNWSTFSYVMLIHLLGRLVLPEVFRWVLWFPDSTVTITFKFGSLLV